MKKLIYALAIVGLTMFSATAQENTNTFDFTCTGKWVLDCDFGNITQTAFYWVGTAPVPNIIEGNGYYFHPGTYSVDPDSYYLLEIVDFDNDDPNRLIVFYNKEKAKADIGCGTEVFLSPY